MTLTVLTSILGCGGHKAVVQEAPPAALAPGRVHVGPAFFVPERWSDRLDDGGRFDNNVRRARTGFASGYRVLSAGPGMVATSEDRFGDAPAAAVPVPRTLGGGWLFAAGTQIYRSATWLDRARPIASTSSTVVRLIPGFDRAYAVADDGHVVPFDPQTGATTDIGTWPRAPSVVALVALSRLKGAAIADGQGLVVTQDGGATWQPLSLPFDPRELRMRGEGVTVIGFDITRNPVGYEWRSDGSLQKLDEVPKFGAGRGTAASRSITEPQRPLALAVARGWPVSPSEAVVLTSGALQWVRLNDGAMLRRVSVDIDPPGAVCTGVSLGRGGEERNAFGFVCGTDGRTTVYAFTSDQRVELRAAFPGARIVLPSDTGKLVVRGPCGEGAGGDERTLCLVDGIHPPVEAPDGAGPLERPVWTARGELRVVVPPSVHPPYGALRAYAPGAPPRTTPLRWAPMNDETMNHLRTGHWIEGFFERPANVLGGWVEQRGSFVGIAVHDSGDVEVGPLIRDLGLAVVSGRYGFGATGSRRGYETDDGGLHWRPIEVPEPLRSPPDIPLRSVGPLGATALGWIRVGWGERAERKEEPRPIWPAKTTTAPALRLTCAAQLRSPPLSAVPPTASKEQTLLSADAFDATSRFDRTLAAARLYATGPKADEWTGRARWFVKWTNDDGSLAQSATVAADFTGIDGARRHLGIQGAPSISWAFARGDTPGTGMLVGRRNGAPTLLLVRPLLPPVEVRTREGETMGNVESVVQADGVWYVATSGSSTELPATVVWAVHGQVASELTRVPRVSADGRLSPARLAVRRGSQAIGVMLEGPPVGSRGAPWRWLVPIDSTTGARAEPEFVASSDHSDTGLVPCPKDVDMAAGSAPWRANVPLPETVWLHAGSAPSKASTPQEASLHAPFATVVYTKGSDGSPRACVEHLAGTLDVTAFAALATPLARKAHGADLPVRVASRDGQLALTCRAVGR